VTRAHVRWLVAGVIFTVCATGFVFAALAFGPQPPRTSAPLPPPPGTCADEQPPAVRQASARVGAYYYDGWSGPLSTRPFNGLLSGQWSDRQPLYGWRDSTSAAITKQLRWAHRYGIGFFVFDWYYNAAGRDVSLNGALKRYRALSSHDGVGYALLYVNTGGSLDSFVVPAARWPTVAARWVTQDFTRPTYERVDGKPLLVILDVARFNEQFGGPKGVAGAIATLRAAAADAGLPGVYVVGGVYVDPGFDWAWFRDVASQEDFDAFTQYSAPAAAGVLSGAQPYTRLVRALERDWHAFASGPRPFIPDVVTGWDPRPWGSTLSGKQWWFVRTPAQVGAFTRAAVRYASRRPIVAMAGAAQRPLVLVEAWNELGEGAYVVPTVGSCHRYGAAVASALEGGP
jgi:hypothetical protein